MTHDYEALAVRVDRASGPDLVLERDIALAVYPGAQPLHGNETRISVWDGNGRTQLTVKPYTASIDAAMTLVPEGWFLTLDRYIVSDDPAQRGSWRVWLKFIHPTDHIEKRFARADTPATAVLSAALRARAATVVIGGGE